MSVYRGLAPHRGSEIESALGSPAGAEQTAFLRAPEQGFGAPQQDFFATLRDALRRGKWVILAVALVTIALVSAASFLMKPKYTATVRIVFYREDDDVLGFKGLQASVPEDVDYSVSLDTQVRIIESDTLALQVIRQLRLYEKPEFTDGAAGSGSGVKFDEDAKEREALLRTFEDKLSVSKAKNTRVIEISFTSKDPALAANVANALSRAYVEHNFKTKFESTMQTSNWLTQQLSELQVKVERSQQKLADYQRAHGILGIDDKQNVITARLDDLNRELTAAEADRIQKEASYRLTLSQSPELIAKQEPDGLIQRLRAQEATLTSQYAQLTTRLGPANPKVQEVQNELAATRSAIKDEIDKISGRIQTDYSGALSRERMVRSALEKQKQAANELNESAIEYNLLKRDVDSNRQLYEGLLEKLKEAGVSAGLRSSNIQIVDVAQTPARPSAPNVPRNIALAIAVGLGAGLTLALVREKFDRTLRSTHQIQMASTLPRVGIIPLVSRKLIHKASKQARKRALLRGSEPTPFQTIVDSNPISVIAESFRTVLHAVLRSDGLSPRAIVITSAVTREGKTAMSINLAIARARQGKRVLLVDADLRKPSISKILGVPQGAGLSTILGMRQNRELSRTAVLASGTAAIMPVPSVPYLFVLPAGTIDPRNPELVTSEGMRALIAEWRESFDQIIIDTPPVLLVADAIQVAVEADAVLLVVRSGYTTHDAFSRAQQLLYQVNAPLRGILLNGVDFKSPDLYYVHEYGYTDSTVN